MLIHTPEDPLGYRLNDPGVPDLRQELAWLIRYQRSTDPRKGDATTPNKHEKSELALSVAGDLIAELIQWAVNHQAGCIIREVRDDNDGRGKGVSAEQSKGYDCHDLERLGASYDYEDPVINRRILGTLIDLLFGLELWPLPKIAVTALTALDSGEVQPFVEPSPRHTSERPEAYSLWDLRVKALEQVEFRYGMGLRKGKARELVAAAFGCSERTVEAWEGRAPRVLGSKVVDQRLERAKRRSRSLRATIEKEKDEKHRDRLAKVFTDRQDAVLRDDAARYAALQNAARHRARPTRS